jgi:predicted transcriptional regulator
MQKLKVPRHLGTLVEREQLERVREIARREDRSISAVVRRALAAELKREETDGHH